MIVLKEHLRLLVGVLVIYCCIESTVGSSIRGVYNYPNSDVSSEIESTETTMSDTTTLEPTTSTEEIASPTKKHRHRTIVWSKKTSKTTAEQPSTEPTTEPPSADLSASKIE